MRFITFPVANFMGRTSAPSGRMLAAVDRAPWLRRWQELRSEIDRNPLRASLVKREFRVELGVGDILHRYRTVPTYPRLKTHPELWDVFSFMHLLAEIRPRLNEAGRSKLDGMVKDGLNKGRGISPLAFELSTAAHFVTNGYSVAFTDMEGHSGGADLLVRKDDVLIDAECKHVRQDKGFLVKPEQFNEFINSAHLELRQHAEKQDQISIVVITIPNRLHNKDDYYRTLRKLILSVLRQGRSR